MTPGATLRGLGFLAVLVLSGSGGGLLAQGVDPDAVSPVEEGPPRPDRVVALLAAEETREEGRIRLAILAASLPPERATPWIQLMAMAERVSGAELGQAAEVVLLGHRGEREAALAGIRELLGTLERVGRGTGPGAPPPVVGAPDVEEGSALLPGMPLLPPFLALAASLADPIDPSAAAVYRARIFEDWPESPEAPEAALLLGRALLKDPEQASRGLQILEELLVRRPTHAVAPEARRLRQEALARGVSPEPDPPESARP